MRSAAGGFGRVLNKNAGCPAGLFSVMPVPWRSKIVHSKGTQIEEFTLPSRQSCGSLRKESMCLHKPWHEVQHLHQTKSVHSFLKEGLCFSVACRSRRRHVKPSDLENYLENADLFTVPMVGRELLLASGETRQQRCPFLLPLQTGYIRIKDWHI